MKFPDWNGASATPRKQLDASKWTDNTEGMHHAEAEKKAWKLINAARACDVAALDKLERWLDLAGIEGDSIPETAAANIDEIVWRVRREHRRPDQVPGGWVPVVWELWCKLCEDFERPYTLDGEWGTAWVSIRQSANALALIDAGLICEAPGDDGQVVSLTPRGEQVRALGAVGWDAMPERDDRNRPHGNN